MKTKEELNALKEEVETLNQKLAELTDEELAQVSGGETVHPDAHVVEPPVHGSGVFEPAATVPRYEHSSFM